MGTFHVSELTKDSNFKDSRYYEFIRNKSLSAGIYKLKVGQEDLQQPHTEDEIYYVISGEAKFTLEDKDIDVIAGEIIYVPAYCKHKFHSIRSDLELLVFFAPAEYSNKLEGLQKY